MQLNLYHRWAEIEIKAKPYKKYNIDINNVGQKIIISYFTFQVISLNMLFNLIVSLVRIKLESK